MEVATKVMEAQRAFRTLLAAMAQPAQPAPIDAGETAAGLHPTTATLIATLADVDTPLWIGNAEPALREWIAFRTGAPLVEHLPDAAFAIVRRASEWPALANLAQGTPEYPDRSATLIVEVDDFAGESRTFDGPGFERPRQLQISHWPAGFDEVWRANNDGYPLGVDVILVSPTHVAGLPRSARLVEAG